MRKLLFAAAATAPLVLALAGASSVRAQTTTSTSVTTSTTTPLATSTSGTIDVAAGGSITSADTTPAVTLDSNSTVTVEGAVGVGNDVDNATGVLIRGGNTGSFASTGSIVVGSSYAASDTVNSDGIVEAPFTSGTGRYGLRLVGASPFTGTIVIGGPVTVAGNNSYGVSLEAPLNGALTTTTVSLTGDNGAAIRETAGVTGDVQIEGGVTVIGQNSNAVALSGDVGGAVRITSGLSDTGYSDITRVTDTAQAKIQATPADVEQGGSALVISGSVAGGVYLSGAPAGTVAGSTADLDGDGTADGSEITASITQTGSAPAVVIGGANKAITLGAFGTGDNAYGFLSRGTISAVGLEDGATATALQFGATGGQVSFAGGARLVGGATASTYEADATALHVLGGVTLPQLRVEGTLSAAIADSTLITTPTAATASAVLIEQGASVGSLLNTNAITASAVGDAMSAQAVVDRSGTLSSITNEGLISATVSPNAAADALTGARTALDLRANTTGVTILQQLNPNPNVTYGSTSGTADTAVTTVTAPTPEILGDIYLGSGPNNLQILAGLVQGDTIGLGSGEGSSLLIDNGAIVAGAVTYSGNSLALNINNGALIDTSTSTLHLSSLNIGATGSLTVAVDGLADKATQLVSSGPATIASGAAINVHLVTAPTTDQSYVLISAPSLSYSGGDLSASTSYLLNATITPNTSAGTVTLDLSRKSQAELGLTTSEYNSLDAVLAGSGRNTNLLQAVLLPTTKSAFSAVYDQLLPDHGGGVFLAAQAAAESIGRATSDRRNLDIGPGAWIQQFLVGVDQDKVDGQRSRAGGFGVVGGFETGDAGLGQVGVTAAFTNAVVKDPDLSTDSQASFTELEGGLYWRKEFGGLQLTARGAGGYLFGYDRRYVQLAATDTTTAISLANKGTWNGWTADGRFGAAYQVILGRWFVRPQLSVEYFRLDQDAFTEHGGGDAMDLAIDARSGSSSFGTASLAFGGRFGHSIVWRPTIEIGARDVFTGNAGDTTAHFAAGGDNFTLVANPITGVGGLAKVGLKVGGNDYEFYVDAQGEDYSKYREGDIRAGVRLLF